jgi:hypothetical protein
MSKISQKKKNNKVNLAVKVHSSSAKARVKKGSDYVSQKLEKPPKLKKPKSAKKIFKKKKKLKAEGFLKHEEKKVKQIKKERIKEKTEVQEEFREYNYKEERAKMFLMKSGVTFFMLVIFIMWIYNTKRSIVNSSPKNDNSVLEIDSWQEISGEISEKMQEIKNKTEEVQEVILEEEQEVKSSSSTPANDLKNISTSSEEMKMFKEEIDKILNNK